MKKGKIKGNDAWEIKENVGGDLGIEIRKYIEKKRYFR